MAQHDATVNKIFDELRGAGDKGGAVTLGQIMNSLGHRGFGPFLFIPALIELSPVGGIPGVPSLLAAIIAIFAMQIALGRSKMWLPGFLKRRELSASKFRSALAKMRPVADWLDKWFHNRLARFAGRSATRVATVFVILLCLTVPLLEIFPFASSAPMATIAFVGLAITVRDGALMLAAFALAVTGFAIVLTVWFGI